MKKVFLLLTLVPVLAMSQTPKTIKAAWQIQQADDAKTNARIDSLISVLFPTPKPEEPKPVDPQPEQPVPVSDISKFVDAYYTAYNVELSGNIVTKIKGVKGPDLPYIGIAKPTITRPYLLNGEIIFTNQPNANFKVQTRDNSKPFNLPEEFTIVFRKLPGTDWEAISSGWGNYYLGMGGGNLRAGNADSYLKTAASLPLFQLCFIHCKYEANGVTLWLNGRNLGKIATTNIYRRLGYGVGIETNSADFNWQASMFIERALTDSEREQYFKAIAATYKIGSLPELPYASGVAITTSGGKMTATYKYNGANAEDKSKVQYQWWQMADGLTTQKLISTASSISSTRGVKVCVKVTDVKGNSWMYVSGTYN